MEFSPYARELAPSISPDNNVYADRLRYHGDAATYFRIWLVNTLAILLTCGLYVPWASVRMRRYIYANTEVFGHRFGYIAQPKQIFKGFVVLWLISVAGVCSGLFLEKDPNLFLALMWIPLTPFLLQRALAFRFRNTTYRNLNFAFFGRVGDAYGIVFFYGLIAVVTGGIAYPLLDHRRREWIFGKLAYGNVTSTCDLQASQVWKIYFRTMIGYFVLLFAFVVTLFIGVAISKVLGEQTLIWMMVPGYILLACTFVLMKTYLQMNLWKATLESTVLGPIAFKFEFPRSSLYKLALGNFAALVATLGLAWPWARTRTLRFMSKHTEVHVEGTLDQFTRDDWGNVGGLGGAADGDFGGDFGL